MNYYCMQKIIIHSRSIVNIWHCKVKISYQTSLKLIYVMQVGITFSPIVGKLPVGHNTTAHVQKAIEPRI